VTSTSTTTRSGSWPDEPREDVSTLALPGQPSAAEAERRTWRRSLFVGLSALVVSRVCMLIGAGVRASQQSVDADRLLQPRPGSPWALVARVFAQWDSNWYLEIVRNGYPRSIPPDITYFQLEARAAFFPLYPFAVRWLDAIAPAGDTLAALMLNVFAAIAAVVLVGLLARRLYGAEIAGRTMVLFAVFPGSFVLSFAYAEALLIVFAAACLLFLIDERWLLGAGDSDQTQRHRPRRSLHRRVGHRDLSPP
jgi:Gpi18-like mannosyltransferase